MSFGLSAAAWVGIAGAAASAGGAAITANAAGNAADAQVNAANQGIAASGAQNQQTRADNAPLIATRNAALGTLNNYLGMTGPSGGPLNTNGIDYQSLIDASGGNWAPNQQLYASDPAYKQAYDEFWNGHIAQFGQEPSAAAGSNAGIASQQILQRYKQLKPPEAATQTGTAATGAGTTPSSFGSLLKPFTAADLANDPGYKFTLGEGLKATENLLARSGSRYGGGALKGIAKYTTGLADTTLNSAFGRDQSQKQLNYNVLAGATGLGQIGANSNQTAGTNYTTALTSGLNSTANAVGSQSVATGNAINNALTSGLNYYQQNALLDLLQKRQTTSGYANPYDYQ